MHLHIDGLHANGNIGDFDEAMELLQSLWVKIHPDCVFTEDEPLGSTPEEMQLPHIVYSLLHRKHSDIVSSGRKPRQFHTYPDPEQPGHNITQTSEWFDCIAEFSIYGRTKNEVREWKNKLEDFMLTYAGYFKERGISDIVFIEEINPKVSTEYRQDLPHRLLRYLVKIQRIKTIRSIRVDDIDVVAKIPSQQPNQTQIIYSPNVNNEFLELYEKTK